MHYVDKAKGKEMFSYAARNTAISHVRNVANVIKMHMPFTDLSSNKFNSKGWKQSFINSRLVK